MSTRPLISRDDSIQLIFSCSVHFAACDVTKWEDQLALFQKAKSVSTSGKIDIVVANAGIAGPDPVFLNAEGMVIPPVED